MLLFCFLLSCFVQVLRNHAVCELRFKTSSYIQSAHAWGKALRSCAKWSKSWLVLASSMSSSISRSGMWWLTMVNLRQTQWILKVLHLRRSFQKILFLQLMEMNRLMTSLAGTRKLCWTDAPSSVQLMSSGWQILRRRDSALYCIFFDYWLLLGLIHPIPSSRDILTQLFKPPCQGWVDGLAGNRSWLDLQSNIFFRKTGSLIISKGQEWHMFSWQVLSQARWDGWDLQNVLRQSCEYEWQEPWSQIGSRTGEWSGEEGLHSLPERTGSIEGPHAKGSQGIQKETWNKACGTRCEKRRRSFWVGSANWSPACLTDSEKNI